MIVCLITYVTPFLPCLLLTLVSLISPPPILNKCILYLFRISFPPQCVLTSPEHRLVDNSGTDHAWPLQVIVILCHVISCYTSFFVVAKFTLHLLKSRQLQRAWPGALPLDPTGVLRPWFGLSTNWPGTLVIHVYTYIFWVVFNLCVANGGGG